MTRARFAGLAVVVVAVVALLVSRGGGGEAARVRTVVGNAVAQAVSGSPAQACAALSPAGLRNIVREYGGDVATLPALGSCEQIVANERAQLGAEGVLSVRAGSIRAVKVTGQSALARYSDADGIGIAVSLSEIGGRWLIDNVVQGPSTGAALSPS